MININQWKAPQLPQQIPHGDMPGDKVQIDEEKIGKANTIFPILASKLEDVFKANNGKAVVCVCGGSGVGKSEIASLLSYYLNEQGIGTYTMSGDNYPRRIPMYNDAERLSVFRNSGIKALVAKDECTTENYAILKDLMEKDVDADPSYATQYPWFKDYLDGALQGLKGYLGTTNEINFAEVEDIVNQFKSGKKEIYLKRMGRTPSELYYEKIDFSSKQVLIIEWTHGNSDNYKGVDIPILLNSTPEETLAHRRARNRDGKTDSAFTMRVLEIEQKMLHNQAHKAKIIIAKNGDVLDYDQYLKIMEAK